MDDLYPFQPRRRPFWPFVLIGLVLIGMVWFAYVQPAHSNIPFQELLGTAANVPLDSVRAHPLREFRSFPVRTDQPHGAESFIVRVIYLAHTASGFAAFAGTDPHSGCSLDLPGTRPSVTPLPLNTRLYDPCWGGEYDIDGHPIGGFSGNPSLTNAGAHLYRFPVSIRDGAVYADLQHLALGTP